MSARGIRRRLQKRANRDDPLAIQILERLQGRQAAGLPDVPMGLSTAAKGRIHATAALELVGLNPKHRPADDCKKGDNVTLNDTGKGNSAAYLAARLKKAGRDDLLEQIGPDMPFRSIRAAAIEAGIVKPVPIVRRRLAQLSHLRQSHRLWTPPLHCTSANWTRSPLIRPVSLRI